MKVLVTGANGYLGQGIVKELLDQGHEVVAASKHSNNIDGRAIIKECDIFDISDPYTFFERPSVVLHLAWKDGFVHYSNAHLDELHKHVSFLSKMAESEVESIAVMGSMHEIGFYEGSIDENTPCHPVSYYGIAKNALRDYAKVLCERNRKTFYWLRGFYIVGNTSFGSSIFSKITDAENRGKTDFPFTSGKNQYDFIDYSDFCKQVTATITQNEVTGIINICSGRPEKLADRVEKFIKDNEYKIILRYGAFPDRPYDSKAVWGNDTKIKRIMSNER